MTSKRNKLPSRAHSKPLAKQTNPRTGTAVGNGSPARARAVIWLLFLAWCFCFAWSFVDFALAEATGSSFVRGINRLGGFLAWQVAALLLAATLFGAGWMQPRGLTRGLRRLTYIPLILLAVLWVVVVIAGIALFLLDRMESTIS